MSSPKPESGVGKQYSTRNQPPKEYNVQRLQNLAENGGKISSAKIKAVNEQVSYVQPKTSEKANAHASDQSQEVQPQSKPQYSPQDGQPSSDDSNEAAPLQPNDIDMGDTEPERDLSEPPNPKMANNGLNSSSSAPVNVNDQSDDEVLVDLKKLSIGQDHNGEPDAWSRLGRSLVLLVRYGPYKAAKYRVQTANGYNTKDMQKVSDLETRISHVTYRG